MVRSALIWIWLVGMTIVFSSAIVLTAALTYRSDPKRLAAHRLASLWGRGLFLGVPSWRLTVRGRSRIRPNRPYVLVANHQSYFDIMALYGLRRQFKWVAKAGLFHIPFLGWALRATRYVPLERGRYRGARTSYEASQRWLTQNIPVFYFPEGTRSRTDQLGPFKSGAFRLAVETGALVIPVAVLGTRELLARGSWRFGRGHVRVIALPPLDPSRYGPEGADRLRDEARAAIERTLQRSEK